MTKILITGVTGFLGSHLYHYLNDSGYDVIGTCRNPNKAHKLGIYKYTILDLSSTKNIEKCINNIKPDIVVHLGAIASPNSVESSEDFMRVNVEATQKICECMSGKKVIFASSVVVYGDQINCTEETLVKPTTLYAATKAASENIIMSYGITNDLKYVLLRMSAIVGKNLTHGAVKDIKNKVKGEQCTLYGSFPGSVKPYLHVMDACRFIEKVLPSKGRETIYNVCPSDNLSIDEIKTVFDPENKCEVLWDETKVWKGDNRIIKCKNDKLKKIYKMRYNTSKEAVESLLETI